MLPRRNAPDQPSSSSPGIFPPAPRLRGPQTSTSSSVDPTNNKQSKKYFLRAVAIGFFLGVVLTRYVNLALQSDGELLTYQANQERAASGLPLPSQDCQLSTTSKTEVTKIAETMKQDVLKLVGEMNDKTVKLAESKMDASIKLSESTIESMTKLLRSSVDSRARLAEQVQSNTLTDQVTVVAPTVRKAADANTHTNTNTKKEVIDFQHQEGVVIAMKIHGVKAIPAVKQSLCLNKYAYNDRTNYDYLVFSSEPVNQTDIDAISAIVAPAKFTLVVDNPGLDVMVAELSPERRDKLLKRCNVTSGDQLDWYTRCREGNTNERIAYSWQAEFRALHLWNHPALSQYRYMLWVDSDGFCTKKWAQDPIATLIRNNLAILFANFPQGRSKGTGFHERFMEAFNRPVCWVGVEDGHLYTKEGDCVQNPQIPQIHGFMHVTDLDFYRSEPAMKWARALIGDEKFSRKFDDQIGITISSAVLAPNRSWLMSDHGIQLDVYHNGYLDGQKSRHSGYGGFVKLWKMNGTSSFPEAHDKCEITDSN